MNSQDGHIPRTPQDEARLDAAIDAVAREMTDAEPSGALRARVLEQIRQDRRRSEVVPRWAWAGAGAAVVLAAAATIWVTGPMRGPEDTRTTVAQQRSGTPPPAAGAGRVARPPDGGPRDASTAPSQTASVPRAWRGADARSAAPGTAGAGEDLHQVPALAEIEPLRFVTVEPDALQVSAVEITAFPAMTPIDIPSLDTGSSDIKSADPKKENRP
jgi:HAMP domain-containing protein